MGTTQLSDTAGRGAAMILVAAAAIFITGAAIGFLAPSLNEAPPFVTSDFAQAAAAIAGNPTAWKWANGLILAAGIITALGLVPLSLRFEGRGRSWALAALLAFAFAAVFSAIDRMITMQVTTWAAQQYPDSTALTVWEAFETLPLGSAFYTLAFIALGLYGIAIVRTQQAPALGWAFVAVGVIGIILQLTNAAIPGHVFLGTAALGAATWRVDLATVTARGLPPPSSRYEMG